ncbi:MAG TPA: FKBP-type peptidyl-prolyl cis-trans isomerase [Arenimonas sp.]|nr:FKBP-type peptidyl-prolyl cis-trans isomerase [Arenimonas sp.]
MLRVLLLIGVLLMPEVADAKAPPVPSDAVETATGMRYVVLKPGKAGASTVSPTFIEYRALVRSADGQTQMGSDPEAVQSTSFRGLARSLPGLARAVLTTPIGETRRWWIEPDQLKPGYPGMPLNTHVIDLTVIGNYDPLKAPVDVAAPPADAQRTASGLAYTVLKKGTGSGRPKPDSTIQIHYSGWTTDGRLFDSSVQRDEIAVFDLQQLIPGWQEGLQLMSPGDTYRFWIPGPLAYDSNPRPGAPRGMLVFDITLFDFE